MPRPAHVAAAIILTATGIATAALALTDQISPTRHGAKTCALSDISTDHAKGRVPNAPRRHRFEARAINLCLDPDLIKTERQA